MQNGRRRADNVRAAFLESDPAKNQRKAFVGGNLDGKIALFVRTDRGFAALDVDGDQFYRLFVGCIEDAAVNSGGFLRPHCQRQAKKEQGNGSGDFFWYGHE